MKLPPLLLCLLLAACARQAPPAATSAASGTSTAPPAEATHEASPLPAGIDWFTGGVDAAFQESAHSKRPVLLYWGASWCPPCQQLKASVFPRQDFQQKSRLFVPVYLDGDAEGAQKWGETFGVSGYPSVVILNADRSEILRIAGGMDMAQYASMLDVALEDRRPARQILAQLATPGATGRAEDCHRVAWQAWDLEDLAARDQRRRGEQLVAAVRACAQPDEERARVAIQAAVDLTVAVDGKPGRLPRALADRIGALLDNDAAAARQVDALRALDGDYFIALRALDAGAAAHQLAAYLRTMRTGAESPAFARGDQLNALASAITASMKYAHDGKPDAPLEAAARARIDGDLAAPGSAYEHSGVVNGVLNVLDALHDDARAYQIARHEVDTAAAPFYYMAELADRCESMGRTEEALTWRERAFREARGAATRFQWGSDYLLALLRLTPGDLARIRTAGLAVVGELGLPDALYRRSRIRLERMDAALRTWTKQDAARTPVAGALRARMQALCDQLPPNDAALPACRAFAAA